MNDPDFEELRRLMARDCIAGRGISDSRVLAAFQETPRHLFVDPSQRQSAYEDHPLPIGFGQTISQPFIVAFMAQKLELEGAERLLEVGTGSGYEAAILSRLAGRVFSIELEPELSSAAGRVLESLGASNVRLKVGDGLDGWPEEAPFDRIVLSACVETIPEGLLGQLAPRGILLAPVGAGDEQRLLRVRRSTEGFDSEILLPVVFVRVRHGPAKTGGQ